MTDAALATSIAQAEPYPLTLWEALALAADQEPWRLDAACRDEDPEQFFGDDPEPAKAICERCPVREDCLAAAMARGERDGVWGGLSAVERTRLSPPTEEQVQQREETADDGNAEDRPADVGVEQRLAAE